MAARRVVLLCGPPGAGKSTAARSMNLRVFDLDDPEWVSERQFRAAISRLALDPSAQAVVIRSGPTSSARSRSRDLINATEVYVLTSDVEELERRVRKRGRADMATSLAAIHTWFDRFDDADHVSVLPGWPGVISDETAIGKASRQW